MITLLFSSVLYIIIFYEIGNIEYFYFKSVVYKITTFLLVEIWLRSTVPNAHPKMKSQGKSKLLVTAC